MSRGHSVTGQRLERIDLGKEGHFVLNYSNIIRENFAARVSVDWCSIFLTDDVQGCLIARMSCLANLLRAPCTPACATGNTQDERMHTVPILLYTKCSSCAF
jgi:hypothetical protein